MDSATFGWGFAVTMSVYCIGWISGAHLNPAVTMGLLLHGNFAWADVFGYIVAPVLGGYLWSKYCL